MTLSKFKVQRSRVKAAAWLCAACSLPLFADDSAHIVVSTRDFTQTVLSRRNVTLTPLHPLPRAISTNLFSREPRTLATSTNGVCVFSNTVWGYYRLDIAGNPGTVFNLALGTNHGGLVSAAALVTNPAALPPNPATNYYTIAQMDALLSSTTGGTFDYNSLSNTPVIPDTNGFITLSDVPDVALIGGGAFITNTPGRVWTINTNTGGLDGAALSAALASGTNTFAGNGAGLTNAPLKLADGSDFIPSKTIAVFFGDSLTDTNGYTYPIWPVRVITRPHWLGLKGHINAAISGNTFIGATNNWATNALPQLTSLVAPGDTVLLSWGPFVNDQILYPPAGATNNPIAFIGQMSNFIAQMRADVSALGGRPFVSGNTTGVRLENESVNNDTAFPANRSRWFINNFFKQSTNLFEVVCNFAELVHPGNSNVIGDDRIHPSLAGHELMADLFDHAVRFGGERQITHIEPEGTNVVFRVPTGFAPLKLGGNGIIYSARGLYARGDGAGIPFTVADGSEATFLLENLGGETDFRFIAGDDNRLRIEDNADGTDLLVMNRNLVIFGQANNLKSITNHSTIFVVSGGLFQANSNSIFRGPVDLRDGHNLTAAGSLVPTNGIFLPTNTFTPTASATGGWLWNSNQTPYWVTSARTNPLVARGVWSLEYLNTTDEIVSVPYGESSVNTNFGKGFTIPANSVQAGDEYEITTRWESETTDGENEAYIQIGTTETGFILQQNGGRGFVVTFRLLFLTTGASAQAALTAHPSGDYDGAFNFGLGLDLTLDTTGPIAVGWRGEVNPPGDSEADPAELMFRWATARRLKY